jgi:serine phosphatase RsbU (regulator of sigma subunit)
VLKQDTLENGTHAGMDIAVCSIDKTTLQVNFAGANRPILYCCKEEFTFIRGNRGGIGGGQQSNSRHFDSHRFVAEPGSMIFLYTDGYADQFGGRRKKKMKNRDVIKMLQTFHLFDSDKQHDLLKQWFYTWKGDLEQTDDILVLGIKF